MEGRVHEQPEVRPPLHGRLPVVLHDRRVPGGGVAGGRASAVHDLAGLAGRVLHEGVCVCARVHVGGAASMGYQYQPMDGRLNLVVVFLNVV